MRHALRLLSRIAAMAPKKDRRALEARIDTLPANIELHDEIEILQSSSHRLSLFFLDDTVINLSPYSWECSMRLMTLKDGRRRHQVNLLMPSGFEPKCEALRTFFVGLETLLRCGCAVEGIISPSKLSSTSPLNRTEIERFCKAHGIMREIAIIHMILNARNTFCHSLLDCDKIPYGDATFDLCFSRAHFNRNCETYDLSPDDIAEVDIFCDDAFAVSEKLLSAFQSIQHSQIDLRSLSSAINAFNQNA